MDIDRLRSAEEKTSTIKMFFYGSLRPDLNMNYLRVIPVRLPFRKARTLNKYTMYADHIPFVFAGRQTSHIIGDVVDVPLRYLPAVDALEGHPNAYTRRLTPVVLDNGEIVKAWLYFFDQQFDESYIVPSGDFVDTLRSK